MQERNAQPDSPCDAHVAVNIYTRGVRVVFGLDAVDFGANGKAGVQDVFAAGLKFDSQLQLFDARSELLQFKVGQLLKIGGILFNRGLTARRGPKD